MIEKFIHRIGGLLILICLLDFISCTSDGVEQIDCNGVTVLFSADVKPIIDSRCATNSGCHGSGSNNGPGPLTTYTQIFQFRSQINAAVQSGSMPKGSSLTQNQKSSIICWIQSGAANN